MTVKGYPLTWPTLRPRTAPERRRNATFLVSLSEARDQLLEALRLLGAKDVVISSFLNQRGDGMPAGSSYEPHDPGVAVYFERAGKPYAIACDTYRKAVWNLRAVGKTIDALRSIERHGASEMLEQAFTGFAALPPAPKDEPWWVVLECYAGASLDSIRQNYFRLARENHPDAGGDGAHMARINRAFEAAQDAWRRTVPA